MQYPCRKFVRPLPVLGVAALLAWAGAGAAARSEAPALRIEPEEARVRLGEGVQLRARWIGPASREGGAEPALLWRVLGEDAGTITADGYYRAPAQARTPATVRVVATTAGPPALRAEARLFLEPVSVEIEPREVVLSTSETCPFRARVRGAADERVTWSVLGGPEHGSISPSGLFTSPEVFATPGIVKVRATSVADPSRSATATVRIRQVEIAIEPKEVTIRHGESRRFRARVRGTSNRAVKWSVLGEGLGDISPSGLYVTPPVMTTPAVVTIVATSVADPNRSATARVRVEAIQVAGGARTRGRGGRERPRGLAKVARGIYRVAAPKVVRLIMPFDPVDLVVRGPNFRGRSGKQYLPLGGAVELQADVQNTSNGDVRWEIVGNPIGRIGEDGVYYAPDRLTTPQVVQIRATSVADPTKSALHTLHIPPVLVRAEKEAVVCPLDGSAQLVARAENTENDQLLWSVEGGEAFGTITETGLYHPPATLATPAVVRVRATSAADPTKFAVIQVHIPAIRLELEPQRAEVRPGRSVRLEPRAEGCRGVPAVTWKLSPEVGTITPDGLYVAPERVEDQLVQVTATLKADPTKSATAILRLRAP